MLFAVSILALNDSNCSPTARTLASCSRIPPDACHSFPTTAGHIIGVCFIGLRHGNLGSWMAVHDPYHYGMSDCSQGMLTVSYSGAQVTDGGDQCFPNMEKETDWWKVGTVKEIGGAQCTDCVGKGFKTEDCRPVREDGD